jgi:hypothetical protein
MIHLAFSELNGLCIRVTLLTLISVASPEIYHISIYIHTTAGRTFGFSLNLLKYLAGIKAAPNSSISIIIDIIQ